ncbi:MAG TPA: peptidoglycan-associated lipoprotein Pal [Methyloceanibacter sp.]|jgi:peptidoglycan-associated lipoprotein|nr:peptidoglycan-associated lipoprotein Pal [Methyloceanibacter sp.]
MRSSGGINHACKLAGVVVIAVLLAACARHGTPQEYGLGTTGSVATPGSPQEFAVNVGDLVHFQQDSSALTGEAKSILMNQVRWLNRYTQYNVTIEGHADERGTREYNLALGARRAMAVKGFLASNGVAAVRIRTISYGKERPIAVCDEPSCWNQNRRAQTVLNDGAVARNY